jgi:[acyl-carrier-protein] S-malonyltransferase
MKTAIVFPGQGSQHVGMGSVIYESYESVKTLFEMANSILGYDMTKIMFEGPEEELMKTNHAQVGIFLVSVALFQLLKDNGVTVDYLAGHSLGELTAAYASGIFSLEDALKVVIERGRVMAEAGAKVESGMMAVLGMDSQSLDELVLNSSQKGVVVANYNCPGQLVISGELSQLSEVAEKCKGAGAKRVIPLKVGGAFHSPVMYPAAENLSVFLELIEAKDPVVPIVLNRTAELETSGAAFKSQLPLQLKSSVQWIKTTELLSTSVDRIIECGPGKVLQGLIKKTTDISVSSVYDKESLDQFLETA